MKVLSKQALRYSQSLIGQTAKKKQHGAALILFAMLLLVVATAAFFTYFDSTQYKVERERRTLKALASAKAALIGWSVAHPDYPGILPFPDRSADGNYDGNSDCVSAAVLAYSHLLGKFPHVEQTAPCVGALAGLASDLMDGYGERLWYAVSRNLVRTSTSAGSLIINPSILNTPTYPWLVVRDKNGQIISNRVAAVILAPGPAVGSQNRGGGLAGAAAYLDTLTITGTAFSNADYAIPNEDFIMGEDMMNVSPAHPAYQQPYEFNDRLVYITIDELMAALDKRVIREAANRLRAYYAASSATPANRFYPYAADLGDTNSICEEGRLQGSLPIVNAASACTHPNPGLATLPAWFMESRWQDYLYYTVSNDCSFATPGCILGGITVGAQANRHALLILTGAPLAGQIRPSNNAANYLDSMENADGDSIFDAVGTPVTATYNDQMLIVAP